MSTISSGRVLRSNALQPSFDPLVFDDIRIGHLLVDHFHDVTILFIITLDGLWLRKYSLITNENGKTLCLIEQINLKPTSILSHDWKVNRAEFITEKVKRTQIKIILSN